MKTLNPINKVCVVYGVGKSVIAASGTLEENRGEATSVEAFPGTVNVLEIMRSVSCL